MSIVKNFKRKIKSISGNSLAEFAVTIAMMATLATTAAPRFSGIGEGAKAKKTLSEIDKIVIASSNFYNSRVTSEGRGRFPGQERYDVQVGGYASEIQLLDAIGLDAADATAFDGYNDAEGGKWKSIFGIADATAGISAGSLVTNDDGSTVGHTEFLAEFAGNFTKSPNQDGHSTFIVFPGGLTYLTQVGDGTYVARTCNDCSPILYVADNEDPSVLFKKYQP